MRRLLEGFVSVFEYLIAGYMILAGFLTTLLPPDQTVSNNMHLIYGTKVGVVVAGLLIVASGAVLIYGKVKKKKKTHGKGLFFVYLCFFWAAILNAIAYSGDPTTWVSNAIMAVIVAILWLSWRFRTEYLNPKHFRHTTESMRQDLPPS